MNKIDFILAALKSKMYTKRAWVISLFAITKSDTREYTSEDAYLIVRSMTNVSFVDPNNEFKLTTINDVKPLEPVAVWRDKITADSSICENITGSVETTLAILLANLVLVSNPFSNKIPFINKPFTVSNIEEIIATRLKDNLKEGQIPNAKDIYVHEYVKFVDAVGYMEGLALISAYGFSEKTILPPDGRIEFRNSLLKEYADRLHEPLAIAEITTKMEEFDAAWLKGDASGETLASSDKVRKISRKKLYLMVGDTSSSIKTDDARTIFTSLEEGWDVKSFPEMVNEVRSGLLDRAVETQLGGVKFKELARVSANTQVVDEDCGAQMGKTKYVSELDYPSYVGVYLTVKGKRVLIEDDDAAKSLVGTIVYKRSPQFCKTPNGNFCRYCIGERLFRNKNGLSLAATDYGSGFLYLFMQANHGKALVTAKLNLSNSIS